MDLEWFIKEKDGKVLIHFTGKGESGGNANATIHFTMPQWLEFQQEVEMWGSE